MEKKELSSKQEKQEFYNSPHFESLDCINIAVVGKTGSGKSSFINAFRNLKFKDTNAAVVRAGAASVKVKENCAKYVHKIKYLNFEIEINFFDSMGFGDIHNSSIYEFLKLAKETFSIIEFDAIIFVIGDRLSAEELKIAKENEEKNVILFFVYNKMDDFLEKKIRDLTGSYSKKKTFYEQYRENKEKLMECINKEIDALYNIIDSHSVFSRFFNEIEAFDSDFLKSQSYKTKIIRSSIYFITSSTEEFLEECYSKDGNRLRNEIENSLVHAKFNIFNIDLLDNSSEKIIRFRKKYVLSNLLKSNEIKFKMMANSLVNFIPGFEMLLSYFPYAKDISNNEMIRNLKIEFMKYFGISDLRQKLSDNPDSISNNREKKKKLAKIFEKIDNNKEINTRVAVEKVLLNYEAYAMILFEILHYKE